MIKAPRYMKEYANSIKKSAERYKKRFNHENDDQWNEIIESAGKIVRTYERGLITENEAMRLLAELSY